jgi:cytochrome c556
MACRLRACAAALTGLLCFAGCATTALRSAMNRIQELRDRDLYPELEAGSSFGSRDAAAALRRALEAPEVAREAPQAGHPEFQQLLRELIESLERVETVARRFDKSALADLRPEISSRCNACHDRFRGGK